MIRFQKRTGPKHVRAIEGGYKYNILGVISTLQMKGPSKWQGLLAVGPHGFVCSGGKRVKVNDTNRVLDKKLLVSNTLGVQRLGKSLERKSS